MKILFDQGVPKPLQTHLAGHEVRRAFQLGWADKKNGELLALAEEAGFDVLDDGSKFVASAKSSRAKDGRVHSGARQLAGD